MAENQDNSKKDTKEGMQDAPQKEASKNVKRHLIKNKWVRRTLKTLLGVLVFILLLPVALYIPPVQTFVKNIACNTIYKSTGMKVEIGRFLLKFPVDLQLDKVVVLDEHADTMVRANQVVADVKMLPLLKLDLKINKLLLKEGYYRMVSPDSSMIMKVNAGLLTVDDKSEMSLAKMDINLNEATLKHGSIDLYMDVWKKKQQEDTTASTPMTINAKKLNLEDFTFGMSMLPTIDTMYVKAKNITLKDGKIDLGKNTVGWKLVTVNDGNGEYLTPTPEWVKEHPAPETPPSDAPPMVIKGDSISLNNFQFLYAIKGAQPLPGFDPSYMSLTDIGVSMKDFYNAATDLRLPITRLEAKERSGLQIVDGRGLVSMDSTGLAIKDININTVFSSIRGSADLPFALMELQPEAPVYADIRASLGMPDIDAFMPDLKSYTKLIKNRAPLQGEIAAEGTLSSIDIDKLNITLRDIFALRAEGYADNPLDIKKLKAEVEFDGELADPRLVETFTGMKDIKIPALKLRGEASVDHETYAADFELLTTAGDVAGNGRVGLNSEKYNVDIDIDALDLMKIMPDMEVGKIYANVKAEGAGFNPMKDHITTNALLDVKHIEYKQKIYKDIKADVSIAQDGVLSILADSYNPGLNFQIEGSGTVQPDDYTFDLKARLRDIDLQEIGLSETMNNGKGLITLQGSASPEKWIYNVDAKVEDFDWNLPNQYIHLPNGLTAKLTADKFLTDVSVDSYMTSLQFKSDTGLEGLMNRFTKVSDIVAEQINNKSLNIDTISQTLPQFDLNLNASGKGLLSQFLVPQGLDLDTIFGTFSKDSLLRGNLAVYNFEKETLALDTIKFDLLQRGALLDYKLHLGNRPGTLDEFASANLNGYIGANRVGAYITQHNLQGEEGYKIGLGAALQDSIVSMHFTPLESTIAYMPWTFNEDNYVDYNIYNRKIDADLEAKSQESGILLKTQPTESGIDELLVKLENIHIQDFTKMFIGVPDITGDVNSDLHIIYDGKSLRGYGNLGLNSLTYEKSQLGDFLLNLKAGLEGDGKSGLNADLMINNHPSLSVYASLSPDSIGGLSPDSIGLTINDFPLHIANPFLAPNASLGGVLRGKMRMDGSFTSPVLNGYLQFKDAFANVTMADATLRLDTVPVTVNNSLVTFDDFDIIGANDNPICIDGNVDLTELANIKLDLAAKATNCQLVKSTAKSKADIFGKLFVNLDGTVKGTMNLMDIKANLNILGTSDVTYRLNTAATDLSSTANSNVVKFVNFNDTTQVADADSLTQMSTMRIRANLTVSPGTQVGVIITGTGNGKVELQPTANLSYYQNFMGDMKLNGKVTTGEGFVQYAVPLLLNKTFNFNPESSVTWSGDIMNPRLDISASDEIKASTATGGNSRLVNFLVTLNATGSLSSPDVSFNLSTNDDLTIQNELQSMSADQRQTQAMNLLLTGQYASQNSKTINGNMGANLIYGFLESSLNNLAGKVVKGVDLSFGINQYENQQDGVGSTETSYSYQVSKSLFNNRFKIKVGGNYSTDSSADENLSDNLISDISMEYMLKQTQTTDMSIQLFRHTGFESILEGEITETGAGFLLKRKVDNLFKIFQLGHRRRNRNHNNEGSDTHHSQHSDTTITTSKEVKLPTDTVGRKEGDNE